MERWRASIRSAPIPRCLPDWYRVQGFDFSGSGFDRGHMVPNADRDKETSIPINQATYLMTNMVAQAPGQQPGAVGGARERAQRARRRRQRALHRRGSARRRRHGQPGRSDDHDRQRSCHGAGQHVEGRAGAAEGGGDDVSRVTCATRTIAVIMPNVDGIRDIDWGTYLTTRRRGRSAHRIRPLREPARADRVPASRPGSTATTRRPIVDPPVVQCGAADGSWHGDNVTIACTASDAESGLSNRCGCVVHADDVGWHPAIENANAATDSRLVCDAVGNCATAGPIARQHDRSQGPGNRGDHAANGGVYQFNKTALAAFGCADGGSGLATCTGTVANGAAIDTSSVGTKSFVVTATDAVGNISSTTVSYTVVAGSIKPNPTIIITNIPADARDGRQLHAGDCVYG